MSEEAPPRRWQDHPWLQGGAAAAGSLERPILLLRWLALGVVLALNIFDLSTDGVLVSVPRFALAVAGYNLLLLLLMRRIPWLRGPLNYLALDTIVVTAAIYYSGGYHSSFFVLYVFIVIGAAFHLDLTPTLLVAVGAGLVYVGACYVSPAGLRSNVQLYSVAGRLVLLLMVAVLCALLLEQLRREHRESERERALAQRLREMSEAQDGFVSAVSHELRTPLTCIKTAADLLDDGGSGLSPEQRECVQTIRHHVGRLETLVADLLDIARLEAGQMVLAARPIDLRRIVRRAVEALRPLTDKKQQAVFLDLPAEPATAEVDRRRIEQVLNNILSNACKFAPRGGRIDVCLSETAEGIRVCVSDNGPGIAADAQPHLFERFYVVRDARGLSGVGLGLYIARQLVELHGGRIWVESAPGRGSTFCFVVPRVATAPPGHPEEEPA